MCIIINFNFGEIGRQISRMEWIYFYPAELHCLNKLMPLPYGTPVDGNWDKNNYETNDTLFLMFFEKQNPG